MIVSVNGYNASSEDGLTKAHEELRKMNTQTTIIVSRRGNELKYFTLNCSPSDPSGMRITDGKKFLEWLANLPPFVKVTAILYNSPAQSAGIMENDEIVWCNSVTKNSSGDAFKEFTTEIGKHRNKELIMFKKRYGDVSQVVMTPTNWGGKGLTGMTIQALT
jgi:hypothetical protein